MVASKHAWLLADRVLGMPVVARRALLVLPLVPRWVVALVSARPANKHGDEPQEKQRMGNRWSFSGIARRAINCTQIYMLVFL